MRTSCSLGLWIFHALVSVIAFRIRPYKAEIQCNLLDWSKKLNNGWSSPKDPTKFWTSFSIWCWKWLKCWMFYIKTSKQQPNLNKKPKPKKCLLENWKKCSAKPLQVQLCNLDWSAVLWLDEIWAIFYLTYISYLIFAVKHSRPWRNQFYMTWQVYKLWNPSYIPHPSGSSGVVVYYRGLSYTVTLEMRFKENEPVPLA